ncbi:MAG: hypothetical protein J5590_01315 [Clostridia bacterium]|nr:hypothetical protein [Clostridia bacterium]
MKNKSFLILIILIALILGAFFTKKETVPIENSFLVKETTVYDYFK